jgi:hypothetical protein
MHLRPFLARMALLVSAVTSAAGCGVYGSEKLSPEEQLQQNIDDYESLRISLEERRKDALGKSASEATGIGNHLFWLEFPTFDPTLHSLDTTTGARVDYSFKIGDSNAWNYRATETMVVTAQTGFNGVDYKVYSVGQSGQLLGQFSTESPGGGVRWYAYAPDGDKVYIVRTDTNGNALLRWTVGAAAPEHVFFLEETGMSVGEFWDFGVEGDTAVMIESGRIWHVDLAAKKATWLENETESTAAQWDDKGVFFLTAKGPFFHSYATSANRNLSAEIEASSYKLNDTYASIHFYSQGGARNGDDFAYIGRDGLFVFDLATKQARPALLNRRDNSIVYRYPTLLENGKLFVQGLESSSGATGAGGKWYEVAY